MSHAVARPFGHYPWGRTGPMMSNFFLGHAKLPLIWLPCEFKQKARVPPRRTEMSRQVPLIKFQIAKKKGTAES